jgi:hypothetical protein
LNVPALIPLLPTGSRLLHSLLGDTNYIFSTPYTPPLPTDLSVGPSFCSKGLLRCLCRGASLRSESVYVYLRLTMVLSNIQMEVTYLLRLDARYPALKAPKAIHDATHPTSLLKVRAFYEVQVHVIFARV